MHLASGRSVLVLTCGRMQFWGLIADMLADEVLPISLVEAESFRALLAYMEPNYKPLCRETMTARLMLKKVNLKNFVVYTGKTAASTVSDMSSSSQVVLDLMSGLLDKGYCVNTDNFFNVDTI